MADGNNLVSRFSASTPYTVRNSFLSPIVAGVSGYLFGNFQEGGGGVWRRAGHFSSALFPERKHWGRSTFLVR